jgi:hypothetical protein
MKYIYYDKDDDEDKMHFLACFKTIDQINNLRSDVIYNSAFPRLKQSKYRGIQAFKQLLKRHNANEEEDKKFIFDEASKIFWLKMYKLAYKHNATSLNINGNNCILINDLNDEEIKKLILIDTIEILDKEPNNSILNKNKDYIKIMANMIKEEGFTKDDCIELFKLLFDVLAH